MSHPSYLILHAGDALHDREQQIDVVHLGSVRGRQLRGTRRCELAAVVAHCSRTHAAACKRQLPGPPAHTLNGRACGSRTRHTVCADTGSSSSTCSRAGMWPPRGRAGMCARWWAAQHLQGGGRDVDAGRIGLAQVVVCQGGAPPLHMHEHDAAVDAAAQRHVPGLLLRQLLRRLHHAAARQAQGVSAAAVSLSCSAWRRVADSCRRRLRESLAGPM